MVKKILKKKFEWIILRIKFLFRILERKFETKILITKMYNIIKKCITPLVLR